MMNTRQTVRKRDASLISPDPEVSKTSDQVNPRDEGQIDNEAPKLETYLNRFKKFKSHSKKAFGQEEPVEINIPRQEVVKFDKGFVNLPREIVAEAIFHKHGVKFNSASSPRHSEYYIHTTSRVVVTSSRLLKRRTK